MVVPMWNLLMGPVRFSPQCKAEGNGEKAPQLGIAKRDSTVCANPILCRFSCWGLLGPLLC
jgi:hypothetical protein